MQTLSLPQRQLGNTDLAVSSIGLGGMPLSIRGRPSEPEAIRVVHAALEVGVTLIDTADAYCLDDDDVGHNERLIHKALRSWKGDTTKVVVATKGGLTRPHGEWARNAHPQHLREACERSLLALGVPTIALYQLHAPDPRVPYEDSVGELALLQKEGKIAHIGLSNVTVAHIEIAQRITSVASVQNRCNPHDLRAFQEGVVSKCEQDGLAFLPWSPVGGGSRKTELSHDRTLLKVAQRYEVSAYEIALAWLLAVSPVMIPIPGASKEASIRSSAHAASLRLKSQEILELSGAFGLVRST